MVCRFFVHKSYHITVHWWLLYPFNCTEFMYKTILMQYYCVDFIAFHLNFHWNPQILPLKRPAFEVANGQGPWDIGQLPCIQRLLKRHLWRKNHDECMWIYRCIYDMYLYMVPCSIYLVVVSFCNVQTQALQPTKVVSMDKVAPVGFTWKLISSLKFKLWKSSQKFPLRKIYQS